MTDHGGPARPRLSKPGDTVEGEVLRWDPPDLRVAQWRDGRSWSYLPGELALADPEGRKMLIEVHATANGNLADLLAASSPRRGDAVRLRVVGSAERWLPYGGVGRGFALCLPKFEMAISRRRGWRPWRRHPAATSPSSAAVIPPMG